MTDIGIACSRSIRASPFAVTTTSPSDFDSAWRRIFIRRVSPSRSVIFSVRV